MSYEAGFLDGERQAFKDRKNNVVRAFNRERRVSQYGRGFIEGYTPRTVVWKLRAPAPAPWWQEREETV